MVHDSDPAGQTIQLPTQIVGPTDVSHLQRELETLEDFFDQLAIRSPDTSPKLPRTSKLLDEFANINKLNLLEQSARQQVNSFLTELRENGPVVHISFASDPSAAFVGKIVIWLRNNIHPLLLVRIGLEPTVAAGCILRTTNRQFDFSLRQHFLAQRQILIDLLDKPSTGVSS